MLNITRCWMPVKRYIYVYLRARARASRTHRQPLPRLMSSRRGPETNCKRCLHRREGKKTRTPNRCQNKVALRYTYIYIYLCTGIHLYTRVYTYGTYVTPSNDITIIIIYYSTYVCVRRVILFYRPFSPRTPPSLPLQLFIPSPPPPCYLTSATPDSETT